MTLVCLYCFPFLPSIKYIVLLVCYAYISEYKFSTCRATFRGLDVHYLIEPAKPRWTSMSCCLFIHL